MAVLAAGWLSLSIVSCTSDNSGDPPSDMVAAPLQFTLNIEDYSDTRGVVSNTMDESVGLFAYLFSEDDQDWTVSAPNPNFMYNEEMQFNGTQWQTVNTFDRPEPGSQIRFYAYYPFGLAENVLELSAETQRGAPDITYTVPKDITEQVDLMAGKSVTDIASADIRNEGAVAIKVSHLLTAVKFQLGKCSEAGRITKIEMRNVLAKNTYLLSETNENVEDPENPGQYLTDPENPSQFLTVPVIDGWTEKTWAGNRTDYSDFSAELNQKVTVTKTQVVEGETVVVPQPLMTDDNAFLMLPQTLPTSATLALTINCGGSDHVLTTSLAGMQWLQGKKVTYTLDITSLSRLTVRSQILPWNEHETIDGVASDGITILMGTDIDNWSTTDTNVNSDDPREGN